MTETPDNRADDPAQHPVEPTPPPGTETPADAAPPPQVEAVSDAAARPEQEAGPERTAALASQTSMDAAPADAAPGAGGGDADEFRGVDFAAQDPEPEPTPTSSLYGASEGYTPASASAGSEFGSESGSEFGSGSAEPFSAEPASAEPISSEPISGEAVSGEPISGESTPVASAPASESSATNPTERIDPVPTPAPVYPGHPQQLPPGAVPGGYYPGAYPGGAPGPWGAPAPGYGPPPGSVPPYWASPAPTGLPPYGEGDPAAAKPKRTGPGRVVVAAAIIAGLVGGGIGAGIVYAVQGNGNTVAPVAETSGSDGGNGLSTGSPNANQITAAAAKVLPSVVTITVTESNGNGDQGSGIIISSTGDILTNNHVVADAATSGTTIAVTFASGKITPAKVLGTDPSSDLAVIKASNVSGLQVATLGDSNSLAVGQTVVAIGAPLGLSNSVTSGIVSALNRPIFPSSDDPSQQQSSTTATQPVLDAIQTDASINPGNSGGPLVNLQGQVIGINSAILTAGTDTLGGSQSGSIGLGFAIPISQAEWIYPELISTGSASHSLLGVEVTDPAASATQTGAVVSTVTAGGPAGKAGIKPNDVITSLNNQQIGTSDALVAAVRSYKPGTAVSITYMRGGQSTTVQVTLTTAATSNS